MENAGALTLTKGASESVTNGKRRGPKGTDKKIQEMINATATNGKRRGPKGTSDRAGPKGASGSVTNGKRRGPNLDQGGQRKRDKWKTPGPQGNQRS